MSTDTTTAGNAAWTTADDALRAALAPRQRPPRPNALQTSLTFGWRALLKIKHVPEQLFDVTIFPLMMTLMFTYLFGGALAGSTGEYLHFLLPGILTATIVMITMYTGMTLNIDIEKGVFDRIRSLPIWRPSALVGALFGDAARYTLAGLVVIALGLVLGFRPDNGVGGLALGLLVLLVFSFSLSWLWTMIALLVRSEKAVMGISMMILFPLTFASNIYVEPETMPRGLEAFVDVNPITHLVTVERGLIHGGLDGGDLGLVALWCVVLVAIFGPLTMRLYARKS